MLVTKASLGRVSDEIRSAGGAADPIVVDALDQTPVDRFVDKVEKAGQVDISFTDISLGDVQKRLLVLCLGSSRTITATEVTISCEALVD